MSTPTTLMMRLDYPDRVGLLARITGFVAGQRGNFTEVNQYTDGISNWFLSRFAFEIPPTTTLESVRFHVEDRVVAHGSRAIVFGD